MSALRELIERCEQGSGHDGRLNAEVHKAAGLPFEMEYWTESSTTPTPNLSKVPQYVSSLDAVVGFISATLPGWRWSAGSEEAYVHRGGGEDLHASHCEAPARALLAAALRALSESHTLAEDSKEGR